MGAQGHQQDIRPGLIYPLDDCRAAHLVDAAETGVQGAHCPQPAPAPVYLFHGQTTGLIITAKEKYAQRRLSPRILIKFLDQG